MLLLLQQLFRLLFDCCTACETGKPSFRIEICSFSSTARRTSDKYLPSSRMLAGDRAKLYDQAAKQTSGIVIDDAALAEWKATLDGGKPRFLALVNDPAVKDRVCLKESGDGGFDELSKVLAGADSEVVYGACPFFVAGAERPRYFFFSFIGGSVGGMKKAKVSMHRSGVYKGLEGVTADFAAASPDEFTKEAALGKIKKDTGGLDVSL